MTSPTPQPADTSETVDKVAFAIRWSYGCEDEEEFWDCDPDYCSCRRVAEQAIAAMREPTKAMTEAASDANEKYEDEVRGGDLTPTRHCLPETIWRAMIDEALK